MENMISILYLLHKILPCTAATTIPPYDPPCGDILEDARTGTITLPTAPTTGTYSSDMQCRWELIAPKHHAIAIVSADFAIEDSKNCMWDYLEIREGNESLSGPVFCGHQQVAFLSTSSHVFIHFTSDSFYEERGFILKYQAVNIGNMERSMCNHTISKDGSITSPNYPSQYPPNTACLYNIQAPEGYFVQLTVEDMDLEDDTCLFDSMNLYDGKTTHSPELATICSIQSPETYTSSGPLMFVTFFSDYFKEGRGFRARVRIIDKNISSSASVVRATGCSLSIEDEMEGAISSPNYPFTYPNNQNCTTIIRSPLPDHVIRLNISFLEMEESENCSYDYLAVYDSLYTHTLQMGQVCGTENKPIVFQSSGGSMRLEFHSDNLISWRGYEARFLIVPKDVSVCYPLCTHGTVCVYHNKYHRCIEGEYCSFNICGQRGTCVQTQRKDTPFMIQCYCKQGYTGTFCDQIQQNNLSNVSLVLTVAPESRSVRMGSNLILECKANNPLVEYIWLYEDLMLQTDGSHVTVHTGGYLELTDFREDLEGAYACLVTTDEDYLKHQFRLTLMDPCHLEVEIPPRDRTVDIGGSALFSCFVPTAVHIEWRKDGQTLKELNGKIKILGTGFYLKVESVEMFDAGIYKCTAENRDGCFVERSAKLYVNENLGNNPECGRTQTDNEMPPQLSSRISRGEDVENASSPWHVIIREIFTEKTFCGGTLVSNKWMVTAAHCIMNFHNEFKVKFHPSRINLFLGTDTCDGTGGISNAIESFHIHPKFGNRAPYDYDIALIELKHEVNFSETVQPICLKQIDVVNNVFLNRKVGRKVGRVVGCGQLFEAIETTPSKLKDVFVPTVSRDKCDGANIGKGNFTDTMFCAGYERALFGDACYGDSGGSLSMRESPIAPWVLVGVVSWGVGCDRHAHYGYYTNVAVFYDWIQNITCEFC